MAEQRLLALLLEELDEAMPGVCPDRVVLVGARLHARLLRDLDVTLRPDMAEARPSDGAGLAAVGQRTGRE